MRIVDFELASPVPFAGQLVRRRADAEMRDPTIREAVIGSAAHDAAALVLTADSGSRETVWVPLGNVRWWVSRIE